MSQTGPSLSGVGRALLTSPAVTRLGQEATKYAVARATALIDDLTERLNDGGDNGGLKAAFAGARGLAEGRSPVRAGISAAMTGLKEAAMTGLKETAASTLRSGRRGGTQKATVICEDIDIGLPVEVVYDQWTQYEEFATFMRGVEDVERTSDTETTWRVKVFASRRTWKAVTREQIPDRRIVWTSDGAKGSTRGVITFHPLADDLTRVLVVMEYYPQGLFERTGNLWRAGGRRARLDLKHFRRFVMLNGEATGSWRGEIRDGTVVRQPEEAERDDPQRPAVDDDLEDDEGFDDDGYDEDPDGEEEDDGGYDEDPDGEEEDDGYEDDDEDDDEDDEYEDGDRDGRHG